MQNRAVVQHTQKTINQVRNAYHEISMQMVRGQQQINSQGTLISYAEAQQLTVFLEAVVNGYSISQTGMQPNPNQRRILTSLGVRV